MLTVAVAGSFLTAIGQQKANRVLFVAALLAPFGYAACIALGPSDASMLGLAAWSLCTVAALMQGATQHRQPEGQRLIKAGLWSIAAMPLIVFCSAATRHHEAKSVAGLEARDAFYA